MLRDIPRIYMLMFGFIAIMVVLIYWYTSMFQRGTDTTVLNEAILSAAVSEVDQSSRIHEGALMLAPTFESKVWESIEANYPKGSDVKFEYLFDQEHPNFNTIERVNPSPMYVIGGAEPSVDQVNHMISRPIKSVRVMVLEPGDNVSNWTYVSTIAIDAASR